MALLWKFLRNEAGEDEGLADAGIETFRDAPFAGLARECGQNSIDAARRSGPDGNVERVIIRFWKETVPTETVPDIAGFRATIDACLSRARTRRDDKEIQFFERARRIASATEIDLLHVIDEGTTGLIGPCEPGTPYHALIKAKGVSKKGDDTSGGSFGIGKNAAYAVSALRSVFYSTVYEDSSGNNHFLAQAKAILVSHSKGPGQEHSATGYWGEAENYMPATNVSGLPEWLQRTEPGTTVTALGFLSEEQWDWRIAESLVRNFFTAVHNGKVIFEVGDELVINRDTLPGLFANEILREVATSRGSDEDLKFSHNLYRCLTSPESARYEETIHGLGRVKLSILIEDRLEKQVGLIRNGMFITSRFRHFREKLARFPLQKDFIAVIEPIDDSASANIRALENPRHDELSPERIEDPQLSRSLRAAVNKMNSWIREKIKSHTTLPPDDEIQLDDLNDFFSAPEDKTDRMQNTGNSEKDPASIKVKMRKRPESSGASASGGSEGGSGGEKPGESGGATSGPGAGGGKGGASGPRGGPVPIKGLRNTVQGGDTRSRMIFFTPEKSGPARLEVIAAGIADEENLPIVAATGHKVTKGACEIELKEGERIAISVELAEPYEGPIEVSLRLKEENDHEAQG
ncbi:hypothetical protein KUV44_14270 [Marinobacter daepoensis]|uniref:Uncharacterized protein n=1 Tax=Marinobacter daepoensis TaxID=262077 RepID=A0ABS3BDL6_9GAMM|nr:hypothetical protein [Marinobacter daepoensis]MBN7769923.1 hypothetical protein [Marinobacter daepoensis]MBY6080311.1 hypothetical protein [Marinobacter daepoensis]